MLLLRGDIVRLGYKESRYSRHVSTLTLLSTDRAGFFREHEVVRIRYYLGSNVEYADKTLENQAFGTF
jgi:hypothetical protein